MKIVQINAVYKASSTGRTTFELHDALQAKGHKSFVFCSDHNASPSNVFQIGNTTDHKIHAFLSRVFGRQAYFSVAATKSLLRKLEVIRPDIVILRNLHANYINLPRLLSYLAQNDVATVLVLHDFWFMTGHCCHYTNIGCDRWQTECHHCPLLHHYNKSLFFDNSRKIFNDKKRLFTAIPRLAVVGVSKWTIQEARESFFKNARILKYIYNWIDLNIFRPLPLSSLRKELGLAASDFVVLGVAQLWSNAKGLDKFVEIARRLPETKVILVGKFVRDERTPANLIAVGEVNSSPRLAEYYSMADVFVNPSVQETFGKVTAEALACGTPVVGCNTTATPELIPDSCGFVFTPDDTETLIMNIEAVRKRGKMFFSNSCRQFAGDNFDKKKQIEKYLELFHLLK